MKCVIILAHNRPSVNRFSLHTVTCSGSSTRQKSRIYFASTMPLTASRNAAMFAIKCGEALHHLPQASIKPPSPQKSTPPRLRWRAFLWLITVILIQKPRFLSKWQIHFNGSFFTAERRISINRQFPCDPLQRHNHKLFFRMNPLP